MTSGQSRRVYMNVSAVEELINGTVGMIIVFDEKGNLLLMNKKAKAELKFPIYTDVNAREIFIPMFRKYTDINKKLIELQDKEFNTAVYRGDGTCFPGIVRCSTVDDRDGSKKHIVLVSNLEETENVIVKLMKAETEMKNSMKDRNEFVANITHELRTPVNGIKGHVTNLLEDDKDPDHVKVLEIILKCCKNMEKIINNMLDFSKIEAGKFDIQEELFDVRECIQHVVDTSEATANGKGIKLTSFVAEEVPQKVLGDELRIVQILNNLVSNAVKFTSIGSVRVEVYVTNYKGRKVELTFLVIDTGIGVTEEEKSKMFKSFSQVDGSITRKYGGTGLGLYVSRQLVDLMEGTIELESEKGKGSTFQVTIPFNCPEISDITRQVKEKVIEVTQLKEKMESYRKHDEMEQTFLYNSIDNKKEVSKNLEKLVLCIEMNNWERSEQFAENLKQLCQDAPKEVTSAIFRLLMAVRKEDYDKSIANLQKVKEVLSDQE